MAASSGTRSDALRSFLVYVTDPVTGVIKRVAFAGDVQIGLDNAPAELHLLGRLSVAGTNYVTDGVNKGIIESSSNDTIIAINRNIIPISGFIEVYLPSAPRDGELHFIKDMTGTAASTPINIYPSAGTTIDGQASIIINTAYGSLAVAWLNEQWRMIVAGLGPSGGSGAPINLSYVTINPEPSLTQNRQLSGSVNIVMTDDGAKSGVFFDLSEILGSSNAGTFSYATVTADEYGRVTAISAGAAPDFTAEYLLASSDANLPNSLVLSGGLGTTTSSIGGKYEINVDPRVVPFLSGATFTGTVIAKAGLSGSLQQTATGISAFIGEGTVAITTNSLGQIVISGSGASGGSGGAFSYITAVLEVGLPDARHLIAGTGTTVTDFGAGASFQVNADPTVVAFLDGATFTGPVVAGGGLSGSLQRLTDGVTAAITGIGAVSVLTGSNGQIVISGSTTGVNIAGAGGSTVTVAGSNYTVSSSIYATLYGSYLLASASAEDPKARTIAAAGGTSVIDGGAGSTLTVSSSVGADKYGSYLLAGSDTNDPQSRTLTAGIGIVFVDGGPGNTFQIIATGIGGYEPWIDTGNGVYTTASISIDSQGRVAGNIGTDVFFFVSGTIGLPASNASRKVSVFGGDVIVSGSLIADNGFTGSLTQLTDGLAYIVGTGGVSISTTSLGQIVISGSAAEETVVEGTGGSTVVVLGGNTYVVSSSIGASLYASYLLASASAEDPQARILAAGSNITLTDGGPGGFLTISAATGGGSGFDPWIDTGTGIYTTSSVSVDSQGRTAASIGTDVFDFVSGTIGVPAGHANRKVAVFGGDVVVSGTLTANVGFSGSLTQLANNLGPAIVGVGSVTIVTNSLGQIIVSGTSGTGFFSSLAGTGGTSVTNDGLGNYTVSSSIGANLLSSYVVIALDAENPNERNLSAGQGIAITDDGAQNKVLISAAIASILGTGGTNVSNIGSTYTISSSVVTAKGAGGTTVTDGGGTSFTVSSSIDANVSGNYVVTALDPKNPNEQVITAGTGISFSLGGPGGNLLITNTGVVSGTICADVSASYVLFSPDAELPNSLVATGLGAVSVAKVGAALNISASIGAFVSSSYLVVNLDAENPNERYIVGRGAVQTIDNGPGQGFVVSVVGTLTDLGTGQLTTTGSIWASAGLTGSLTQVAPGDPFLIAGTGVTLSVNSLGQWTINSTGGGGSGGGSGDPNASYLLLADTGSLPNGRAIAARGALQGFDNGPGTSYVLVVTGTLTDAGGGLSQLTTTGSISAKTGFTGSLTQLTNGAGPFIAGAGLVSVSTNSLGGVLVSGSIPYAEIVFLAGDQTTESNTAFFAAGARSFDTTKFPANYGYLQRYVQFIATLQNTSGSGLNAGQVYTNVQLWDVRNAVVISGSQMNNSSSVSRVLPYDVTSTVIPLGTSLGQLRTDSPGMYEIQVEKVSGSMSADASTCSNARLIIFYQ